MHKTKPLPAIRLIGIRTRTNNASEMNPETAKINLTIQTYFQNGLSVKTAHRIKPGTTYCAYTDYESDFKGDYTFFIGEEVSSFDDLPAGFSTLTIPAQDYAVFHCGPGPMPAVCVDQWHAIWAMEADSEALAGRRSYLADFEIYDAQEKDPKNMRLDIYVGLRA